MMLDKKRGLAIFRTTKRKGFLSLKYFMDHWPLAKLSLKNAEFRLNTR